MCSLHQDLSSCNISIDNITLIVTFDGHALLTVSLHYQRKFNIGRHVLLLYPSLLCYHIQDCIPCKMSLLPPHAFLGLLPIFIQGLQVVAFSSCCRFYSEKHPAILKHPYMMIMFTVHAGCASLSCKRFTKLEKKIDMMSALLCYWYMYFNIF